jgi:hypothetical protein
MVIIVTLLVIKGKRNEKKNVSVPDGGDAEVLVGKWREI